MTKTRTLNLVLGLLLVSILLLSLALRAWGGGFGLPAYTRYHPDEHALVDRAAKILWTGDWNLGRFNYPPLYAYLQAGAYASYFLWGAAQGQWNQIPPFALPQYYRVGRLLTALVGTLTVLVVYLIGRQIGRRRTGLLAAALLGGCYLHVIHSHYATFDVMLGLWAALTLLFSQLLREEPRARWYLLAGLCAGFAGATKYNGAIALVMPLLAHILVTPWDRWGWLNGRLYLVLASFLAGFFVGNPFALGNLPDFLNGLALVLHHYGTEQPGFEGTGNWRWYLRVFFTSPDALWVATGIAGLAGIAWKERHKGLLLASFPVLYFVVVAQFVVRFERNMVPLLPFLALGGGWLLTESCLSWWSVHRFGSGSSKASLGTPQGGFGRGEGLGRVRGWRFPGLAGRLAGGQSWPCVLPALAAGLILIVPLLASIGFATALSATDHREQAGRWVEDHIEPGSKIAIEHYAIPFDRARYDVKDVIRISDRDLDWYRQEGYAVLIISDGVWELLRRDPQTYHQKVRVYDELVANSTLLAEFVPKPPGLVVAGYPTVAVYHFAPVRIYEVRE